MKLVLKFNALVKLYDGLFHYETVLDYIEREMNANRSTIQLSFIDQEGDQIMIGSDQDISIMSHLAPDQSYLKITVTAQEKTVLANQLGQKVVTQVDSKGEEKMEPKEESETKLFVQEIREEMKKNEGNKKEEDKIILKEQKKQEQQRKKAVLLAEREQKKAERLNEREKNRIQKLKQQEEKLKQQEEKKLAQMKKTKKLESEEKPKIQKTGKDYATFSTAMAEVISKLVDERVRALNPSVKEQLPLTEGQQPELIPEIVHNHFTCLRCLASPIVGVRYNCPKCKNFSICQRCEKVDDHEHNLIKIKKIEEGIPQKKTQDWMKILFDNFFSPPKSAEDNNREKRESQAAIRFSRYGNQLKLLFGGKTADYKKFTAEYDLNFYGLAHKYCELNGLNVEEARQKYINLLTQQLTTKFSRDQKQMRLLVEENIQIDLQEMVKIFTKQFRTEKIEQVKVVQKEKKEQKGLKEASTEPVDLKKVEVSNSKNQTKKQKIYKTMFDICGKERASEYPNFIELNVGLSEDQLIELWFNNTSVNLLQ